MLNLKCWIFLKTMIGSRKYIDEITFARASTIFKKYPGLSITDASTVAVMEELGIKKVYSFDKGFDMIDWVVRLK